MQRSSMEQPVQMLDLCVALLGLTGAGKSASGNTILGEERKTFEGGYFFESKTKICAAARTEVNGQRITVIDTVGLSETKVKITDIHIKIEQIFDHASHGVDVFLLVIKLDDKFTKEIITAMKWIQEIFGTKVLKHTIVLFTHADQLCKPIEDYLGECEPLRSLVDQCSGAFHVFNNKDRDRAQVTELLDKTESLRRKNVYRRYNEKDYKDTQVEIIKRKHAIGLKTVVAVGSVGGVLGAAAGSVAARMRVTSSTPGNAALTGASLSAAACVALYFYYKTNILTKSLKSLEKKN